MSEKAIIDSNELSAAEEEANAMNNIGVYKHIFHKPFTYEGKTYSELNFAFNHLTGEDALAIENEMQAQGKPVIVPTFSGEYLVRMAARACAEKIGQDVIRAMPISEYNKIRSAARSFLLKSE